MKGSFGEIAGGKGGEICFGREGRRETVVGEFCGQGLGGETPLPDENRICERRRRVVVHEEGMGEAHAQRVVDDVADCGTVARTREAVGQPPVLQRFGNGAPPVFDVLEDRLNPSVRVLTIIGVKSKCARPQPPLTPLPEALPLPASTIW